ncbi:MAG: hypothetical protein GX100_08035 [candidate division WS1 bacterium]|jgi:hypothetical protein|nr:hypothetical protein [candidate division WS1 bacterium]
MATAIDTELPNPFQFEDGTTVQTVEDWHRRREEIYKLIIEIEYGGLPPTPERTWLEQLNPTGVRRWEGVKLLNCRIHTGPDRPFTFLMTMLIPPGDGPFPVVIAGDGCWRYATDQVCEEVLRRGIILTEFNRVEIAPDIYNNDRNTGIYLAYPEGHYGALSAWAWGYHRCVDVLSEMEEVAADKIAVVGHSRGGKTVLLAAATDERIALTAPNNSGCGGAGCYRVQGPESETIEDIIRRLSYWFGPGLREYVGRETELPFDQHYLKALVAPRALLSTEALGDLWSNPSGTWQTHLAAREMYRFLGAEDRIGIGFREGGHDHGFADWCVFLDFMEWQLCDGPRPEGLNTGPFDEMPRAFSWSAP